jgi:sulfite dehydrogenase (cytochrome) subunit B
MRLTTPMTAAVLLSVASASAAGADEMPVDIKAGSGAEKVEGNCTVCHSLDYIRMNSFLSPAAWDAEVSKMINAFGAPISAADAKTIVDYLSANYGK